MLNFISEWIEIFRAGDYGAKGVWTPEELDKVVSNFDAGIWKAPAVLGHPKDDSPAMGWVSALRRTGKTLLARFTQVQPELVHAVRSGRFPNRSAAFYLDPRGTGPVLRHVGFLGATPPEVKGLAPVKFSDGTFIAIEFEEPSMRIQLVEFTEPRVGPFAVVNMELAEAAANLAPEIRRENPKLAPHEAYGEALMRLRRTAQFAEPEDSGQLPQVGVELATEAEKLVPEIERENPKLMPHQAFSEALRRARARGFS